MISALAWIPRGAAKAEPEVAELTEAEIEAMKAAAAEEGDDVPDVRAAAACRRRLPPLLPRVSGACAPTQLVSPAGGFRYH
jgi:hypothetical protein